MALYNVLDSMAVVKCAVSWEISDIQHLWKSVIEVGVVTFPNCQDRECGTMAHCDRRWERTVLSETSIFNVPVE